MKNFWITLILGCVCVGIVVLSSLTLICEGFYTADFATGMLERPREIKNFMLFVGFGNMISFVVLLYLCACEKYKKG